MVNLLSEKTFLEQSFIGQNFNTKVIKFGIKNAQNINLQEIIGGKLLNKIEELVEDDSIRDIENINYKNLLDNFITDFLIAYTLVECVDLTHFKITNKSVTTQNSDNSEAVDLEDFKYAKSNLKNKAEFYGARLQDYLYDNRSLFPEYKHYSDNGEMPATTATFNCPMQFD